MKQRITTLWWRLWSKVKEPRVVSFLAWTGYVAMLLVGAYLLLHCPEALTQAMGPVAMKITSSLITVGGLLGSIGSLPGWLLTERLGISMILGGLLPHILFPSWAADAPLLLGMIYFVSASLASRWIRIKDHVFELGSRSSEKAKRENPSIYVRTEELDTVESEDDERH